jgi:ATP-dependent DNA ligase
LLEAAAPSNLVQVVDVEDDGELSYSAAFARGLEGVLAKREDSHYRPGVQSRDWLKLKPSKTTKLLVVDRTDKPARWLSA